MAQSLRDEMEEHLRSGRTEMFWSQLDDHRLEEITFAQRSESTTGEAISAFFRFHDCEIPDESDFKEIEDALGGEGNHESRKDCLELIAVGIIVAKGSIDSPDESRWKQLARRRKFKGKIRQLERVGFLRVARREKIPGRRAFLIKILALCDKWSLHKRLESAIQYDPRMGGYKGWFYEVAEAVNEIILKISARRFALFTGCNGLGKELMRFLNSRKKTKGGPP